MSIEVQSLVKRRLVGSQVKKSILHYMADCASEDGSGIWVSKPNMAADLEIKSVRTVQSNIKELIASGLVEEVGKRPCKTGFTFEYRIVINAVLALPSTREGGNCTPAVNAPLPLHVGGAVNAPLQEMHPTPAGDAPHPCRRCTPTPAGDAPKPSFEPL